MTAASSVPASAVPVALLDDAEIRRCPPPPDDSTFGSLCTERGHLPLKAMQVEARIVGLLSHVTVRQTFVNTQDAPLEATYIFPLPDRAAVVGFRMEVAGRVIEGVLEEREKARREYDEAIRTGHRAAITEEDRAGVFTMRVGNVMPGEAATVRLVLTGPLPYADGEATFRFPLVVAPRYVPGVALDGAQVGEGTSPDTDRAPDASRISPPVLLRGYPNPVRLALSVAIDSGGLPLGPVRSSLHAVCTTEESGRVRRISVQPGERLDRDFILRIPVGGEGLASSLVTTPDGNGLEGTFALTVVPPLSAGATQKPRDVVLVLDRSGSMQGWKMVAARRAAARMVDTLCDRDRFSVYAFDTVIESPPAFGHELVPATDRHRFRAVEFLAKLEARGGTEMAEPLELAAAAVTGGYDDRERVIVLVTDGQVANEDEILARLAPRLKNARVFTVGIDRAVNAAFLTRLAELGRGHSELVESEDRLDEVMEHLHRKISPPVLTGVHVDPQGLDVVGDTVMPERLADVFAGTPLRIMGRYRGAPRGAVVVRATDAEGRPWTESLAAVRSDNAAVATAWARGHIRELEDRFVVGRGDARALERSILETSLRFGVLCRFTAFVAVDRSEVVNPGGGVHRVVQPVEMPDGWEDQGARTMSGVAKPMRFMASIASAMMPPRASPAPAAPPTGALPGRLGRGGESPADAKVLDALSSREDRASVKREAAPAAAPPPPSQRPRARAATAPLDRNAVVLRIRELCDRLAALSSADPAARLAELAVVFAQLPALASAMRGAGWSAADVELVRELAKRLSVLLDAPAPTAAAIDERLVDTETVLRRLAP